MAIFINLLLKIILLIFNYKEMNGGDGSLIETALKIDRLVKY